MPGVRNSASKGSGARSLGEGMGGHERLAQMQSPEPQREVSGSGERNGQRIRNSLSVSDAPGS